MRVCILNASNPQTLDLESDVYVDLRDRASCYENGKIVKQNRSWHSWAYSLETEFFVYNKQGWPGCFSYDGIILLINRDPQLVVPLIKKLKDSGKMVAVSYHEGLQNLLKDPGKLLLVKKVVDESDFYINIFGQYKNFFENWLGKNKVKFVNHASLQDWDHGLKIPWEERTDNILVGTRTFNNNFLTRNTFITLAILSGYLKDFGKEVDFICEDSFPYDEIKSFLTKSGFDNVNLVKGPFEYNDWLKRLAHYKFVVHHDTSSNLGQINLDCAILDVVCLGSTTWLNILSETDDCGETEGLIDLLNLHTQSLKKMSLESWGQKKLREKTHPEFIKHKLLDAFREFE